MKGKGFFSLLIFVLLFKTTTLAQIKKTSISGVPQNCLGLTLDVLKDPVTDEITGYRCQRYAIYPWYASQSVLRDGQRQKVWETQMSTLVGPSATKGGVQSDWTLGNFSSLGDLKTGLTVYGGAYEDYRFTTGAFTPLRDYGTFRTDLFSAGKCSRETGVAICEQTDDLAVGPLDLVVNGYDGATVFATSLQLKYFSFNNDGEVAGSVGVDPVYQDEATSVWVAHISESSPSKRSAGDAEFTTFAVVNYSLFPQRVRVTIRDMSGEVIFSKDTPELSAGSEWSFHKERILSGGWYANALSVGADPFMGDSMFPQSLFGDTFVGTITLEGLGGGKIAPIVLNIKRNWVLSACKVKPILPDANEQ